MAQHNVPVLDVCWGRRAELATNRIFRHGDTGQIIFVDMRRSSLSIAEIAKDLAHVVHFLSAVTGRNIFSFRGGERQQSWRRDFQDTAPPLSMIM